MDTTKIDDISKLDLNNLDINKMDMGGIMESLLEWATTSGVKLIIGILIPVSYTHLTLPTICSV